MVHRAKRKQSKASRNRRLLTTGISGAVCVLVIVLGINASVRYVGQNQVSLWAVDNLTNRAKALASFIKHTLFTLFEADEADVKHILRSVAKRHGVSAQLVLSIAQVESSYRTKCISEAGAMGLMQLMPDKADELGVNDPFDARQNADGGVRFIKSLQSRYRGDLKRVLAAYNAGPNAIPLRGSYGLPAETITYVKRVLYLVHRHAIRLE